MITDGTGTACMRPFSTMDLDTNDVHLAIFLSRRTDSMLTLEWTIGS